MIVVLVVFTATVEFYYQGTSTILRYERARGSADQLIAPTSQNICVFMYSGDVSSYGPYRWLEASQSQARFEGRDHRSLPNVEIERRSPANVPL